MSVAQAQTDARDALLLSLPDSGYRTVYIDPMFYGKAPERVELVTSLEHTMDALIELHTEPSVEPIAVYVRNIDVYADTPVHTLIIGLAMFARRRNILFVVDSSL